MSRSAVLDRTLTNCFLSKFLIRNGIRRRQLALDATGGAQTVNIQASDVR